MDLNELRDAYRSGRGQSVSSFANSSAQSGNSSSANSVVNFSSLSFYSVCVGVAATLVCFLFVGGIKWLLPNSDSPLDKGWSSIETTDVQVGKCFNSFLYETQLNGAKVQSVSCDEESARVRVSELLPEENAGCPSPLSKAGQHCFIPILKVGYCFWATKQNAEGQTSGYMHMPVDCSEESLPTGVTIADDIKDLRKLLVIRVSDKPEQNLDVCQGVDEGIIWTQESTGKTFCTFPL